MSKAQEQAVIQRAEAKRLLKWALSEGVTIDVDRIIDCIIVAAILEMAAIQESAMNALNKDSK